MKYLLTCCAVAGLAALSLGLPAHHATPPAHAAGPQADAGRGCADLALPVLFDADGGELMVARLAFESGNYLLSKARHADGAAARHLLAQAKQHYRACLAHEGTTPGAAGLFADARWNLEAARKLLGPGAEEKPAPQKKPETASRVARSAPAPAAPAPKPPRTEVAVAPKSAPKSEVRHDSAGAAEGLMVGPDGVIYRREAEGR
jgi:hypothetical protein